MITIDIHPNLFSGDFVGAFVVSWHGFLTFIAVLVAVVLVGRWAPMKGIDSDAIYSIAIWAIIGGIIGARLVHVIDEWDIYQDDPAQILAVWSGGIGLWGGILGGFIGGAAYAYFAKHPVGIIADLTAPVLPFAQSIGRIGDIINGEHCAKPLDLFFGMRWSNLESPAVQCANGGPATMDFVHPVIVYEILWNMLSMAVLWMLRDRIRPTVCSSRFTWPCTPSDASRSRSSARTRCGRWGCRRPNTSRSWSSSSPSRCSWRGQGS